MARVKLSEFRAKKLLADKLGFSYTGISIDAEDKELSRQINQLSDGKYVLKIYQTT